MIAKKAQFNFAWMFAIIVGGAILFLAIYGALQTGDTKRFQSDTESAKSISILTDPLQAGFSEGSFGKISFPKETRINNVCFSEGEGKGFGENQLSVSTRSNIGDEWNLPGAATSIQNKYIFSDEKNTGEEYYVFSKPFYLPYKVSDLVFITPKKYCFFDSPDKVLEDLEGLNIPNIQLATESEEGCTIKDPINVCFKGGPDCDINVYGTGQYNEGTVEKSGESQRFTGNLMYAAIFSEKENYECNVERLFYRSGKIAEGLIQKADLMDIRGCDSNLKIPLAQWADLMKVSKASEVASLESTARQIDKQNSRELCRLW